MSAVLVLAVEQVELMRTLAVAALACLLVAALLVVAVVAAWRNR